MKKLIAVLMGGLSEERKISFQSGKACSAALKRRDYKVVDLDVKSNFLKELKKIKPNIVFNALHGKYGEDGFVQTILESAKIPYTHSGVISSSLAMNKELSRIIFKKNDISVPSYFPLTRERKKKFTNKFNFPLVVKPINEGSSLGVYICKNKLAFQKKM